MRGPAVVASTATSTGRDVHWARRRSGLARPAQPAPRTISPGRRSASIPPSRPTPTLDGETTELDFTRRTTSSVKSDSSSSPTPPVAPPRSSPALSAHAGRLPSDARPRPARQPARPRPPLRPRLQPRPEVHRRGRRRPADRHRRRSAAGREAPARRPASRPQGQPCSAPTTPPPCDSAALLAQRRDPHARERGQPRMLAACLRLPEFEGSPLAEPSWRRPQLLTTCPPAPVRTCADPSCTRLSSATACRPLLRRRCRTTATSRRPTRSRSSRTGACASRTARTAGTSGSTSRPRQSAPPGP